MPFSFLLSHLRMQRYERIRKTSLHVLWIHFTFLQKLLAYYFTFLSTVFTHPFLLSGCPLYAQPLFWSSGYITMLRNQTCFWGVPHTYIHFSFLFIVTSTGYGTQMAQKPWLFLFIYTFIGLMIPASPFKPPSGINSFMPFLCIS